MASGSHMLNPMFRPSLLKRLRVLILPALLAASCAAPVTVTSSPTSTVAAVTTSPPTAPPAPSPAPTPIGFVLPAGCSYVRGPFGDPSQSNVPISTWEFSCGSVPDPNAAQRIGSALSEQGWAACVRVPGVSRVWKGSMEIIVSQSAAGYPTLSQLARQSQDCP